MIFFDFGSDRRGAKSLYHYYAPFSDQSLSFDGLCSCSAPDWARSSSSRAGSSWRLPPSELDAPPRENQPPAPPVETAVRLKCFDPRANNLKADHPSVLVATRQLSLGAAYRNLYIGPLALSVSLKSFLRPAGHVKATRGNLGIVLNSFRFISIPATTPPSCVLPRWEGGSNILGRCNATVRSISRQHYMHSCEILEIY